MKMVRVDGHRLCLVRTSEGVFAIDHACPHEGYGLTQGDLDGDLLTCAWHNWKFRVSDGACVLGEENVRTHEATVAEDGAISVTVSRPDPAVLRPQLLESMRRGIANDYIGQVSRDVVRLLQNSANPGELIWEAVAYGAPRADFGWGHAIASATDCLSMLHLYDGDQRALPIVQGIAGIAEEERGRPVNPLPRPAATVGADAARRLPPPRRGRAGRAGAIGAARRDRGGMGCRPDPAVVHRDRQRPPPLVRARRDLLAEGVPAARHDRVGAGEHGPALPRADDRVRHARGQAPVHAAVREGAPRSSTWPSWPGIEPVAGWHDDGRLLDALLGEARVEPLHAAVAALRAGAGIDRVLDVVVAAVSERMLRYEPSGEFDFHDDFGWLDITHGITYANAVRWHNAHLPGPDAVRLALWCVFQANWTGRHEWHTGVGRRVDIEPRSDDLGPTARHSNGVVARRHHRVHRPRPCREDAAWRRPRRPCDRVRRRRSTRWPGSWPNHGWSGSSPPP